MRLRNSLAILCSAAFCFSLALTGCNTAKKQSSSDSGVTSETTFTVTFDTQGGSEVAAQTVKYGDVVAKPDNPKREGYKFLNWYEDKEAVTIFDFSTEITSNWTIYAGWQKKGSSPVTPTPDPDPDPEPQPVNYDYYIWQNDVAFGLTKNDEATLDTEHGQTAEYMGTLATAAHGDTIQFYKSETPITDHIGHDNGDAEHNNAAGGEGGIYTIRTAGAYLNVYLKVWGESGYSFWITGYEAAPVATSYSVQINSTSHALVINEGATLDEAHNQTAEYMATALTVSAGDTVTFFNGDAAISSNIGHANGNSANNNAEGGEGGVYTIRAAGDVDVYLQIWDNGAGYSFWITGYSSPAPVYSIHINDTVVEMGLNPNATLDTEHGQEAEYMASFAAESNDAIKFFVGDEQITSNIGHDNGDSVNNNAEGSDGNYTIRTGGSDLSAYLKKWVGGYSFWITGYTGGGSGTNSKFYVKIAAEKAELTLHAEAVLASEQKAEYVAHFDSVTAGSSIVFYQDDDAITSDIGPDAGKNNVVKVDTYEFEVRNNAEDINVYFKLWENGKSFWVEGYYTDPASQISYTANNLPDWIGNNDAVIFAWVWGPSDNGWVELTYDDAAHTATFKVDAELTGFVLARCIPGTITPNWEEKNEVPGKVWNKTSDVICSAGVYTYSLPQAQWQ